MTIEDKIEMNLNKFDIGDIVHVDARIIDVREIDGELFYSVKIENMTKRDTVIYDIPECFIANVF